VLAVYNLSNGHLRVGETLSAPPNQTNDMEIDPTGRLFVLGSNGIRMRRVSGGPRLAPVSDADHGTGPLLSTYSQREAYDLARDRLLVTDAATPVKLFAVDVATGNRSILSGDSFGSGPDFVAPLGVAVDSVNDRVLVLDGGTLAMIAVDPVTGDRSYVTLGGADPDLFRANHQAAGKGGSPPPVGTGPLFQAPRDLVIDSTRNIAFTSNERLMNGILIVDLVSGDRLLLSR
jgi:DNA-binding beta-propeller fold protein YncE